MFRECRGDYKETARKMKRKWEECKGKKTRMLSEDNISRSKQFGQMLLKGQVGREL